MRQMWLDQVGIEFESVSLPGATTDNVRKMFLKILPRASQWLILGTAGLDPPPLLLLPLLIVDVEVLLSDGALT